MYGTRQMESQSSMTCAGFKDLERFIYNMVFCICRGMNIQQRNNKVCVRWVNLLDS
jgi:hypothetical protein